MNIPKEKAMLIDIQYVQENRKEGTQDYLYIIWKDLDTNEKHLESIKNPQMPIYFTKPEYRNYLYNKNFEFKERLYEKVVPYKDIIWAIKDEMGDEGKRMYQDIINTRSFSKLKEFYLYPYSFAADYDIRSWYRMEWLNKMDNERNKPITKGYMDIEVDTLDSDGFPDASFCPIDLITLIEDVTNTSYTFALIYPERKDKDINQMHSKLSITAELKRRRQSKARKERQLEVCNNIQILEKEAHDMFDENYPEINYKFYFYEDEAKMIVHLFQLINKLKLDFIEIWNMPFDIPYIIKRLTVLGLDPKEVMCHPDFKVKQCYFKKDNFHFQIKNKADYFDLSSYTIFTDDMRNYTAIRKQGSELRSSKLTYIAKKELKDEKLDYNEYGNLVNLACGNYILYILYNIKDVHLQRGIEHRTMDLETFYATAYKTMTPYADAFKQTVKLRNVAYKSFSDQGLIPGNNINRIIFNTYDEIEEDDEDDEDTKKDDKFEGALVGNTTLIDDFGVIVHGKHTNYLFHYTIDMDMSRFYPSSIGEMNIDSSTLIFKCIVPAEQFDCRGGDVPYHGITDIQLCDQNDDSFNGDIAKEVLDNFQTGNYLEFGYKWMNLPSVNEMYEELIKEMGE